MLGASNRNILQYHGANFIEHECAWDRRLETGQDRTESVTNWGERMWYTLVHEDPCLNAKVKLKLKQLDVGIAAKGVFQAHCDAVSMYSSAKSGVTHANPWDRPHCGRPQCVTLQD